MSQEMNARRRTTLKSTHILGLEAKFMEDSRPSNQVRAELAKSLNLNERTVQIWFQNRRTKARASGAMPKACFRKPKSTSTTTTTNQESNESENSPLSVPSDSTVPYSLNFNIQHITTTPSQDQDLPHPPTKSHSYHSLPLPHYSPYPSHYPMDSHHPHDLPMDLLPLHDPYLALEPTSTAPSYPMDLMYNFGLSQHHPSLPMDLMFHHQSPSLFTTHPYPHLH